MRPRADLHLQYDEDDEGAKDSDDEGPEDDNVIIRRGIPYGEEVGDDEKEKTKEDRGLLFVCYQGDIRSGFNFLTTRELATLSFHDQLLAKNVDLPRLGEQSPFSRVERCRWRSWPGFGSYYWPTVTSRPPGGTHQLA